MPSKKILEEKQELVKALSEKLQGAVSGVLVDYTGITVEDDTALRKELRAAGVEYKVYKNKLCSRACENVGFGDMVQYLNGMSAIAISTSDPIAPAKIIKKYTDKIETFNIKAGFIDGAVVDAAAVNELADIPSKEILIGKMLGSLQSSLYGLAYVLQAKIDKDGGAEAPAEEAAEAPAEA